MIIKNCNSCSAPIFWAINPAGNKCPVDSMPVENGEYIIGSVMRDRVTLIKASSQNPNPRYTSHFKTCKDAAKWSKRKAKKT